jgi:hypothetical protein
MGDANDRGTHEERKAKAIERNKRTDKLSEDIKAAMERPKVLPPDFVEYHAGTSEKDATVGYISLVDVKNNCVLDQMIFPFSMLDKEFSRCLNLFNTALQVDNVT